MAGKRAAKAKEGAAKKAKVVDSDESPVSPEPNNDNEKVTVSKKDLEDMMQSILARQPPVPSMPEEAVMPISVERGALEEHGEPHIVKKRGKPNYSLTTRSSKWMLARSELQAALDTYKLRVSFLEKSEKEAEEAGVAMKNRKGYSVFCHFGYGTSDHHVFEHRLELPTETAKHAFGETFYEDASGIAERYGFSVRDLLDGTFNKDE